MKLQVTQENLHKALTNVSRVASTRGTLPILSNVLLKTVDGRLSIAATNLDIAITQFIGAKVSEDGLITVPARLMQDFISSLPSGVIDMRLDESKLHIETEQYQSVINGISAEDYPVMPDIDNGQTWSVSATALKTALQQVVLAASGDEARPVLTGVYMHVFEGSLYVVATDSYRLAEKKITSLKSTVSLLIPAAALQELMRVVGDSDDDVTVTHDDQQVLFRVGDVELVTRLIEGTYPDYRKLIPEKYSSLAEIKKSELQNITKVSSLFARENAGSVTINLDESAQAVSIRSVASQVGENIASAPAKVTGDGTITLNSRYILDALHVIGDDTVRFGFNGKLEPSVIKGAKTDDYNHIVMPLKS
ncbi:DNA polymerase III subunit beta [Candidatus Saccharibacteria bacterium]|nr:MAG: DNA polymerase III subunit beta [Candidatus Saccharibacteria bacterium]